MKLMLRQLVIVLTALSFAIVAGDALAQKKKRRKKKKKSMDSGEMAGGGGGYRWGMAGCGLGAIVMGPDGNQILAVTTNATFYSQLFGITTGTSECTDAPAEMAKMEQEVFIEANLASLSKEAAQGSGETLAGLAEVMGCADSETFATVCQRNHASIFSEDQVQTVRQKIIDVVKSDENLAKSCTRAS
mgnify:CR=1 FL=1